MFRRGVFTCAVILLAGAALAGGTRSFKQTTARDFEEGEATASTILPTGEVAPGMKTLRIPIEAAFAWCGALARDGRTAYFGTGDQGRIFSVAAGGAARKLAELDAAWVTALAVRPDGGILAGSTPGGRIFAVNPTTSGVRVLAKLPAEHVWALVHDARTGATYAAAGGPGKVFAVDAKGVARVLWDAGDKHVVALADAGGGALLAGTADGAILYRVQPDGRALALHDFEADEVRAIARAGNATYVAVNDFDKASVTTAPAAASGPTAARGTRITPAPPGAPAAVGGPPRPGQVKSRAAVYKLEDEGGIEQLFTLPEGYFTALVAAGGNDVHVAAGTQGKIYRISLSDRTVALAVDLPERQALSMVRTSDGFLVGTGDVGGIYRVRPASSEEASYLSKVLDAEAPARWGTIRWSGGPGLGFETRAGNTAKPDKSWSEWRKLDAVAYGGGQGEGRVAGSPSRYLQYRVGMPGKAAVLREATVFYLPQNQRARVTDVTLDTGSVPPVPAQATRTHSPILKLRWKVENPDADELVYRLSFRQEGESVWRPLGGPDPLTKPEHDWNTESVPDGRYVVRVWTSDEKVTPRDRALDHTFESVPFLVDNSKPEVTDLAARPPLVTGRVRDDESPVSQVEFSVDGNEWRPASPADGLLDGRAEAFSLRLPALAPGPHVVTVRAFDAADNVGSARVVFQIAK